MVASFFTASDRTVANTTTTGNQVESSVVGLPGGGWMVVYQSGAPNDYDIYGQRYDANGGKVGAEMVISNTDGTVSRVNPAVSILDGGGFVVTWQVYNPSLGTSDIYARAYNPSGVALGGQFQVSFGNQDDAQPQVAAISGGGFVITWQTNQPSTGGYDIHAHRFDASAGSVGGDFRLNTTYDGFQTKAVIAHLAGGGFAVAWQGENPSNFYDPDIYVQRFDATGVLEGSETIANAPVTGFQGAPSITALTDGGFVVSWVGSTPTGVGVFAQAYDPAGAKEGSQISVAASGDLPSIAGLSDGGFVVVHTVNGAQQNTAISAQRYSPTGAPVGSAEVVSAADFFQGSASVSALSGGGYVVTWQASNGDGSGYGIFQRTYTPDTPVNAPPTGTPTATLAPGDQGVAYHLSAADLLAGFSDSNGDTLQVMNLAGDRGTTIEKNGSDFIVHVPRSVWGAIYLSYDVDDGHGGVTPASQNLSIREFIPTTVTGGVGDDVIYSGRADEFMNGGDGVDTAVFYYAAGPVRVNINTSVRQNTISRGNDVFINFENIEGSDFGDVLIGDNGDNVIEGGIGDDSLTGGGGIDTASYEHAASGVRVNLALTGPQNTGGAGVDTLKGFERVLGSAFDDVLAGSKKAEVLLGGDGNDLLQGGGGLDTLNGGAGRDTASYADSATKVRVDLSLTGSQPRAGKDTLISIEDVIGSNFDDILLGTDGDNTLDGGLGNDTVSYENASDGVRVSLNNTGVQVTDGAGWDKLISIENLTGSNYDDVLSGNLGDNVIIGGDGVDLVLYGHATSGVTVDLSRTTAQDTGGAGRDTLRQIEDVNGTNFADRLTGSAVANEIRGGGGNDIITGGRGADRLFGNDGADTFVYLAQNESIAAARDIIFDFSRAEGDLIDLSAIDANNRTGIDDAFTIVTAFTRVAGQLKLTPEGSNSVLVEADLDGNGKADFVLLIKGENMMQASDFIL